MSQPTFGAEIEEDLQFTLQKINSKKKSENEKNMVLAYGKALTPIQELKNSDNEKSYEKKKAGMKMSDVRKNLIHKLNANKENMSNLQNFRSKK